MDNLKVRNRTYIDRFACIDKFTDFSIPKKYTIQGELIYLYYSDFNIKTISIFDLIPQFVYNETLGKYLQFYKIDPIYKQGNFPLLLYIDKDKNKNTISRYDLQYLNKLIRK